jgi:2,3-bisphosphoglycerate-independent phosphoglycerate mutase
MKKQPLILMILDGWGNREECSDNAVSCANPRNFYALKNKYPYTQLKCCGRDVGLPDGQMGNSEVGHLNIGSGRIVYQEITRISKAIEEGSFFSNPEFKRAMESARDNKGALHLMGLVSDGGVHSHLIHLFALLQLAKEQQIERVFIHAFLDGRDVGPSTAMEYINELQKKMDEIGVGRIATLAGRFYAMDRDQRWERTKKAYDAMVLGKGRKAPSAFAAIQNSYEARITDEFVEPVVIIDENARPLGQVRDGDSVIFFNFRADRARQLSRSFVDTTIDKFPREARPKIYYLCMTQYDVNIEAPVAFLPQNLSNTLSEVLAAAGLRQLRIAETEKYAHVTFFFNGGVEEPNPGEDRALIPSPAVETYNLKPEMSAAEITDRVIKELARDYYDVIIMNYANPDMVGHTGVLEAAIKAVETVDRCLIKVVNKALEKSGTILITADHGNCEMMVCPDSGNPFTAHTINGVPFILVSDKYRDRALRADASLQDIAPTMLSILGVPIPEEMTGTPLITES